MKFITTLLLLFTTLTYAQEKTSGQISIPFTLSPNGHIIIPAKINGIEGQFIFDTGAGLNLLTKKFADQLQKLEKTDHFYTGHRATGEALQSDLWTAESLTIGDFEEKDAAVAVYDIDFPVAGLVSLTPFKNRPITINFKNKMLTIESESSLQKRIADQNFEIPLQITNNREIEIGISTRIELDDKLKLDVSLDSGAGFGVYRFSSRYMETLGIDSTQVEHKYIASPFKPNEGNDYYRTTVATMNDKEGNTSVNDFTATFIDGLIHEGIMGIDWIGKIITIDIPGKRLLVVK